MEVDDDRCGLPEASLRPGATTEAYAAWALAAGMFFVERGGELVDLTGIPFEHFLSSGAEGLRATLADWELHITTLFPEARLRGYLEIRGTDSNRLDRALAHAALWMGLVYGGPEVEREGLALTEGWSHADRLRFHRDCARHGLEARGPDGRSAGELARRVVSLAGKGLDLARPDERGFLLPAEELAAAGRCPADELREAWRGRWERSITRMAADLSQCDRD
jgi:glutamate--cysteine ligase